jgi:hypothetical protein
VLNYLYSKKFAHFINKLVEKIVIYCIKVYYINEYNFMHSMSKADGGPVQAYKRRCRCFFGRMGDLQWENVR